MKKDAKNAQIVLTPSVEIFDPKKIEIQTWNEFLAWIENTSLFHAIKICTTNRSDFNIADFVSIRSEQINLENIQRGKEIKKAIDLPKELLLNFFINSPWYHNHSNSCDLGIQKMIQEHENIV